VAALAVGKTPSEFGHSARSEESLFLFMRQIEERFLALLGVTKLTTFFTGFEAAFSPLFLRHG
jgi:hypothetical protein